MAKQHGLNISRHQQLIWIPLFFDVSKLNGVETRFPEIRVSLKIQSEEAGCWFMTVESDLEGVGAVDTTEVYQSLSDACCCYIC
jgi:hypothetical protein